jgi:hypothetical protein
MSGLPNNNKAKRVYAELRNLTSYNDPQAVARLYSEHRGDSRHVHGLEGLIRSQTGRHNFGKDGSRNQPSDALLPRRAQGKKFRKLRKTRQRKQKRGSGTRRATNRR